MQKLIMVGMRFQDPVDVSRAAANFKTSKEGIPVVLRIEDNPNGIDGKALAVYHNNKRVGFIRNKDLEQAFKTYYQNEYIATTMCTNYWIIEAVKLSYADLKTKYDSGYTASPVPTNAKQVSNPCSEIQLNPNIETKMNISSNMRDSFFREVKNVAIDFQSGKFGVISSDGISVYAEGGVSVNPITEFGIKVPAFAMRIAVADLKEGDIIINGNESSFFKGLTENGYEVVSLNGEVKQVGNVANLFFGKNSVLAVKNMFSGAGGMNPMMMALMLGDGKDFDMKTFAMMSMMGGGQMDNNMLMMMALMGK